VFREVAEADLSVSLVEVGQHATTTLVPQDIEHHVQR
jgi:hypothetical protein